MKKIYIHILVFSFSLISCERETDLNINSQTPKLVVDANIENDLPPVVVLSESFNYFSTITPEEASGNFVHNAVVTVSDGSKTVTLKEYNFADTSGYTFYYYCLNTVDPSQLLYGKLNTAYTLTIKLDNGEEYKAAASIPALRKTCDSLYWITAPGNADTSRCVLYGYFTDPAGLGDYVRYFTSVNGGVYYPGYNSVFNDQIVDGTSYTFQIPRGFNKNDTAKLNSEDFGFFHRGDSVVFKFCNIDNATYTFWNTWEFSYQSIGNPFSSPNKVIGNISNGALGNFSGYAAQYRSIIIPK